MGQDFLHLFQYSVYAKKVADIKLLPTKQVFQTINAYSYVMAEQTPAFKQALQNADILIPDGFPIVLSARILKGEKITKIAGADLFYHFMNICNTSSGRVFFIGSSEHTLIKIKERAQVEYPHIAAETYSPPYKPKFTKEDSEQMIQAINEHKPDVVFVGMTAPKQEMWVEEYKLDIQAKAICSIGAVFDFYAGTVTRAPQWMIRFKLEWFYRLIKEPKRMWKRYLVYSPLFFIDFLKYFLKIKK